jgi:hypothetical protein
VALARLLDEPPSASRVVEISGAASSGKATLALHLCLAALRDGRAAGWIDSGQGFHPLAALEAGEPLERLLVVRVPSSAEALRAADLLLSCSGSVAIAVVSLPSGCRPPESALLRLQRLAERSASTLIFLDEQRVQVPSLGAPVSLRLCVHRDAEVREAWTLEMEVTRHKGGTCGPLREELPHGPDRLRLHRTL